MKKLLAVLLVLCMAISLVGCTVSINIEGSETAAAPAEAVAAEASDIAQVDETHWAGTALNIESVETAEEFAGYVDGTLFCNVEKIVFDNGEIDVDSSKYVAILTVDGVQYDLYNAAGESFVGDVVITLAAKGATASGGNSKFGDDAGSSIGAFAYTAGAYYDGAYQEANSVTAALGEDATVGEEGIQNAYFDSEGDYFSGVYASAGNVSITDSDFYAFGKGGDDFTGQGCVVIATGSSQVEIESSRFTTGGALRSAIWCGGSSTVNVRDSFVQSYNEKDFVPYNTEDNYATSMMQQVPFALGLMGNIRATLDCGQGTINFYDSLISSEGWAVLSTDSGSGTMTNTDTIALVGYAEPISGNEEPGVDYDFEVEVADVIYGVRYGRVGELSGYIAYCDGFSDYTYGGEWYAPDYLAIITGGTFMVDQSDTERFYGWSDRIAFMSHKTSNSTLLDVAHSDFDVTDTFAVVKSAGGNGETINLTDVTINLTGDNAWGGNLLEVIDSDDLGGGPGATTFTIPYSDYDAYLAAENSGNGGMTTLTITDSELEGNIYDSRGSMNGTSFTPDGITVNLNGSSLKGIVSSAYATHCDENGTLLTGEMTVDSYGREGTYDYLVIGRLVNFAAPTVCNPVAMSLTASTWECTGLSYLSSLTLDADSSITGDVYVDGQKVELTAGTYENVIVVPVGTDLEAAQADMVAAIEEAIANGIVPEDHSDLVANSDLGDGGSGGSSDEASGEASGEASDEPAGEASEEPAGEASEEPAGEASGETSGEAEAAPAAEGGDMFALYIEYMKGQLIGDGENNDEFAATLDAVTEETYDETAMPFEMFISMGALGYEDFTAYYEANGEMPAGSSWE